MPPTITITEDGPASASLAARNVRDLAHVRRLLLQSVMSVESNNLGAAEHEVPLAKLHLLRGFLANVGCPGKEQARRLLLMALLQLEDEDDAARFVVGHPVLPVIAPGV